MCMKQRNRIRTTRAHWTRKVPRHTGAHDTLAVPRGLCEAWKRCTLSRRNDKLQWVHKLARKSLFTMCVVEILFAVKNGSMCSVCTYIVKKKSG